MSDSTYRPWREAGSSAPVLDPAALAQWRDLLDETRRATGELRRLIALADGAESLAERLDSIEQRLAALERRGDADGPALRFPQPTDAAA